MANIKDLKKKIKSTKGTLKITTAMKLVSAADTSIACVRCGMCVKTFKSCATDVGHLQ